jgi:hypothetical protein
VFGASSFKSLLNLFYGNLAIQIRIETIECKLENVLCQEFLLVNKKCRKFTIIYPSIFITIVFLKYLFQICIICFIELVFHYCLDIFNIERPISICIELFKLFFNNSHIFREQILRIHKSNNSELKAIHFSCLAYIFDNFFISLFSYICCLCCINGFSLLSYPLMLE